MIRRNDFPDYYLKNNSLPYLKLICPYYHNSGRQKNAENTLKIANMIDFTLNIFCSYIFLPIQRADIWYLQLLVVFDRIPDFV